MESGGSTARIADSCIIFLAIKMCHISFFLKIELVRAEILTQQMWLRGAPISLKRPEKGRKGRAYKEPVRHEETKTGKGELGVVSDQIKR